MSDKIEYLFLHDFQAVMQEYISPKKEPQMDADFNLHRGRWNYRIKILRRAQNDIPATISFIYYGNISIYSFPFGE